MSLTDPLTKSFKRREVLEVVVGEVGGEAEEGEERKEAGGEEEAEEEEGELPVRMPTLTLELVAIFFLTILHSYLSLHLHTYHTCIPVVSAVVPFQIWQFMQALLDMDLPFSVLVPMHGGNLKWGLMVC